MKERVVLITGARKGIGRFLAEHYLRLGHFVVGCSRTESDLSSNNYRNFTLDVTDEQAVVEMFQMIRREFGCLDVLINNAGIASMNHVITTTVVSARRVFDTNVVGTFLFCREAAKLMRQSKCARIVNLSSVARPMKLDGEAMYVASKAAVESLTQVLAKELAPFGITVNSVGPSPVTTDLTRGVPDEKIQAILCRQAIHRKSEPSDIVNVVDFFIRPESDFVTGQIIYLGGV